MGRNVNKTFLDHFNWEISEHIIGIKRLIMTKNGNLTWLFHCLDIYFKWRRGKVQRHIFKFRIILDDHQ